MDRSRSVACNLHLPRTQVADDATLRPGLTLTLETAVDNGAALARWGDTTSDIVETAIDGELTDTPPRADSHGTSAPAPPE